MGAKLSFIFDLDGTVVNPGTAIPRCINAALKKNGEKTVPIERLKRYIGFSLEDIFADITKRKDKRFIKKCIDAYRERFHKEGIAEHRLYPGIVGLLDAVAKNGSLFIASIKPQVSCEMVLDHLGVKTIFSGVYGGELTGKNSSKVELIKHVMNKDKGHRYVVIGDRAHDIDAAKKCNCTSIGVSYGYGTREELRAAGADVVAETVGELRQCLLQSWS
ncbi:MAG: HAD hydrolase-like protein [Deltaproteobacteria bacterium]|nr:HAD hydrolase-like protein [Deltaproteobacteria bacterium]